MPRLHELTDSQKEALCRETFRLFLLFCETELKKVLYPYQKRVAWAILHSLLVSRKDVFIKIARQSGKSEVVALVLKFLMIFHLHLLNQPLMSAIASPNGEQAKTLVDRLKRDILTLKNRFGLEDRENNAHTVRAFRRGALHCEMFRFSLAPTTSNESKTLNLLVIDEAHKINDKKRRDELAPMLISTAGITIFIGVGCTTLCDFKRGCDGLLANSEAVIVPVDEVIADRRQVYEETGDPVHLAYEHTFAVELRKYGRENPEICRNYYLEDTVEEGNFIARERLLTCARPTGTVIPLENLYAGIDWARSSDYTWLTLVNDRNDVVDWFKYPHGLFEHQVELMNADLERKHKAKRLKPDGTEEEYEWCYKDRVQVVRGDASGGTGDAPNEMLRAKSGLPVGDDSFFKFTLQSKDQLYVNFQQALFKPEGEEHRFSYPGDHPLTAEFEDQMVQLVKEYKGDGEYLSVHHPMDQQGAKDDAPDATALALLAAAGGHVGELLFA